MPCGGGCDVTDLDEGKAKAQAILERVYYDAWEDAKIFYENRPTREAFEAVLASLNYDGADIDSLTVGEIRRAMPAVNHKSESAT